MNTDTTVRRAAGRVLAAAFAHDPWAGYVLGRPGGERPRALARLFAVPVAVAAQRGGLVVEPGASGVAVAVSTWVPADARGIGFVAAARAGALTLPLEIGPATMARLVRDEAGLDDVLRQSLGSGDAYLWVLGVDPAQQGRGLGRVVVERTCRQAAACGLGRVVLNTENPANVALYTRLGFDLLDRQVRPSGLVTHVLARSVAAG